MTPRRTVGIVRMNLNVGTEEARYLDQYATERTSGNRSMAIRQLIDIARRTLETELVA